MSRDYQEKAKNKANQDKTSTERLRSLKKSILMPQFKGGRHIYEAFFIRKGSTYINFTRAETPQNKRRKVTDNIHFSFHFVYLKL